MPGHLQPYGNHGVLVLHQDSWREWLLGTSTKLGLKVLKIKNLRKNVSEKPTNTPIIHSVYQLCMVAPTCFGITLPGYDT
jgi:hypothetical protein